MLRIRPGPVRGSVAAPPSKSYTHRALVAAAALDVGLGIDGPLRASDTLATRDALRRLGYPVEVRPGRWTVGRRARRRRGPVTVDCGASGTTLRFVAALAARDDRPVRFHGSPELGRRPMAELEDALRRLGARVDRPKPGGWPLVVQGPIHAGSVRVPSRRSSQFLSALMLALSGLPSTSRLSFGPGPVSRPYVDATVATLRALGATVRGDGSRWTVGGGAPTGPGRFRVPGDASSAANLWVAAATTGGTVAVRGIDPAWPQSDLEVLRIVRRAGASVDFDGRAVRVTGRARRPIDVDLDDAPDLLPLVTVLAATIPGESRIRGAAHAAEKESDRRSASAELARGLGARVRCGPRRIEVHGRATPGTLPAIRSTDHRVIAAGVVGALASPAGAQVRHPAALAKSYPSFWRDLRRLGVRWGAVP